MALTVGAGDPAPIVPDITTGEPEFNPLCVNTILNVSPSKSEFNELSKVIVPDEKVDEVTVPVGAVPPDDVIVTLFEPGVACIFEPVKSIVVESKLIDSLPTVIEGVPGFIAADITTGEPELYPCGLVMTILNVCPIKSTPRPPLNVIVPSVDDDDVTVPVGAVPPDEDIATELSLAVSSKFVPVKIIVVLIKVN